MGCPVSTAASNAPSSSNSSFTRRRRVRSSSGGSQSLRKGSFIHEMLRPQLDPSVAPIGFSSRVVTLRAPVVHSTIQRNDSDNEWMRRRVSLRRQRDVLLVRSASVESCLARVISLRDQIAQQSVVQQNAVNGGDRMGGVAAGNMPNHSPQPSISSAASELSPSAAASGKRVQKICGTAVTFEWLFQRLVEKFKCREEQQPQWIVEKMNDIGDKDLDRTTVLRITFGWENPKLPRSVILKICERHEDDPPEEAKLAAALFKRECLTYEWLSKQHRVNIPRIFVIKKQWSRSCNALLVMEDLSEMAQIGELTEGVPLEGVRDLLRSLAQLHALSMVRQEEWRQQLEGARLPPFFFDQMERFARELMASSSYAGRSKLLDIEQLRLLESAFSGLEGTVTRSCAELGLPECLLHGHPIARNVFFKLTRGDVVEKRGAVHALIDWTQAHCGCFGEDLAKAICWNLDGQERAEPVQLLKLLQYYHYQLLKKLQSYGAPEELQKGITLNKVQAAYERFIPSAAVTFLLFLPEELNHADSALLERVQQLLDEAAEMVAE